MDNQGPPLSVDHQSQRGTCLEQELLYYNVLFSTYFVKILIRNDLT